MSPAEVGQKYPDAQFFVTALFPLKWEIFRYLHNTMGIQTERILNFEAPGKTLSCPLLETSMNVTGVNLLYCCYYGDAKNPAVGVPISNGYQASIRNFIATRDRLIRDNQDASKKTSCTNCPLLQEAEWPIEKRLTHIVFGVSASCQLSCIYCPTMERRGNPKELVVRRHLLNFDFAECFDALAASGILDSLKRVDVASGEITIHPKKNPFLSRLFGYQVMISSNGVVYDETVSRLIQQPGSYLYLSLDSGTRNGYYRIKRLDAFERVVGNIRRYRREGGDVWLKYIVIPENNKEEEITGFYRVCRECNIRTVHISVDNEVDYDARPREILETLVRMVCDLKKEGIEASFVREFFSPRELAILDTAVATGMHG